MELSAIGPVESHPLKLRNLTVPDPGPGELRLRVLCCGICHTDLHIVEGDIPLHRTPIIPGHQVAGIVDAVGRGVDKWREGDRIGVPWLHSTCGECRYCLSGNENLCERPQFTGYDVNGGFAEFMMVREDFAVALPTNLTEEKVAPLLCAGIIGYRAFRLSGACNGDRVGLFGFGASAHLTLQLARHFGCEAFVFTRTESHKQHARELGAFWVGAAGDEVPEQLDAAIIFAPAGPLVLDALRKLRKGGIVALAGITMSPIPQIDYSDLYHERVIRSVANATRQDAREFMEIAADVPIKTEVTSFRLEKANQALAAVKHSRIRGAAVLQII